MKKVLLQFLGVWPVKEKQVHDRILRHTHCNGIKAFIGITMCIFLKLQGLLIQYNEKHTRTQRTKNVQGASHTTRSEAGNHLHYFARFC